MKTLTVIYNDGAIERKQVEDNVYNTDVADEYEAFREIVQLQGNEWDVVQDMIENVDNMLDPDEEEINNVPDSMMKEYFDKKFNGSWIESINWWLGEVDISGDRDIMTIIYDGETIRG